ncbi:MAG: PQQ-binding-like beta-propeller repeat protein, partial [Planctomycetales bacterium]|nr:PQQ-binding-like beta-propeller repeat protein [Planctomycetales bacterium]
MAYSYDPYTNWLGIPESERPITYYRLLAIKLFENNPTVISAAAQKRAEQLQSAVRATNSPDYQRILKEIATARDCLLDPVLRERYDGQLRQRNAKAALKGAAALSPSKDPPSIPTLENQRPPSAVAPRASAVPASGTIRTAKPMPNDRVSLPSELRQALPIEEAVDAIFMDEPVKQKRTVVRRSAAKSWLWAASLGSAIGVVAIIVLVTLALVPSQPSINPTTRNPMPSGSQSVGNAVAKEQPRPTNIPRAASQVAITPRPLRLLPPVDPTVIVGRTYTQRFQVEFAMHWAGIVKYSLDGEVPKGAALDANRGLLVWTPTIEQANKVFRMTIRAAGPTGYLDERTLTAKVITPPEFPPPETSEGKTPSVPALEDPTIITLNSADSRLPASKAILQPLLRLGPHEDSTYLTRVVLSPSGRWLAVSNFSQVYLWLISGGERGADGRVLPVSARHHKTFFAQAKPAPAVNNGVRDRNKKKTAAKRPIVALCFSPNERRLVTASDDGQVYVWDAASGAEVRHFKVFPSTLRDGNYLRDVTYLPDGNTLVVACANQSLSKWDAETGQRIGNLLSSSEEQKKLLISPDGSRLVVVRERTIAGLDLRTDPWKEQWEANVRKEGHQFGIGAAEISPDGRTLVSGDGWGVLTFWDLANGSLLRTMQAGSESVHHLTFLGNGEILATSSLSGDRGMCQLRNTSTMALVGDISAHHGPLRGMAVSADGGRLATIGQLDRSVIVWQYETTESPAAPSSPEREKLIAGLKTAPAKLPGKACRLRPLMNPTVIAGRTYKQQIQIENGGDTSARVKFALESGAPPDAAIGESSGLFTWKTTTDQINQRYVIIVRATLTDGSTDVREMFASVISAYEKFPQDVTEQQVPWKIAADPPLEWTIDGRNPSEVELKCVLRPKLRLGPIPGNVGAVVLSHSGDMVAACVSGEVLLWNLSAAEGNDRAAPQVLSVAGMQTLVGHRQRQNLGSTVNAVRFTPDDRLL